MKVFYLGSGLPSSTSRHRADALSRNGHQVTLFDAAQALGRSVSAPLQSRLHYRSGYRFLQRRLLAILTERSSSIAAHDAVWVDSGELFGRRCVSLLSGLAPTVLVNVDDPTGGRDGRRFDSLIAALPAYDLCVTVREPTLHDFRRLGAKRAMKVWRSYDEVAHRPPSPEEMTAWPHRGDIAFIGTWMRNEGRDEFLLELMRRGVPLSVWGDRWNRAPRWAEIQSIWRGSALSGREYCQAIAGAEACLGFLSKGNRDQHTQRTFEVPFAGGLFVAERTPEHEVLFENGMEALLWSDASECADQCLALLADPQRSRAIRAAGMARIRRGGLGNQDVMASILSELMTGSRVDGGVA